MKKTFWLLGMMLILAEQAFAAIPPPEDRGIWAIWYKNLPQVLDLPFVKGGQAVCVWADVEKEEGKYDFTILDEQLKKFHEMGRKATVQINGSRKPDYLFDKVAILPRAVHHQVQDKKGTLQFWDPIHKNAYANMVRAYGEHFQNSPYKDAILGIRMNFNAIGTEQGHLKDADVDWKNWTPAPDGHVHQVSWSAKIFEDYRSEIAKVFVEAFQPGIRLFFRGTNGTKGFEHLLRSGQICIFQTGSEIQPRADGGYKMFFEFCKPGNALAYAESWADAWGVHGVKTDPRFLSPCQYNYWRLLSDMNMGVTFIAVYGTDLKETEKDPEFRAGFEFAAKYAGFHAAPEVSPGAWVALREGDTNKGDYTFLMKRDEARSTDVAVDKQGPDDQRFGQWARAIEDGGKMTFVLDPVFAQRLKDQEAQIRVVYLDEGKGTLKVQWSHDGYQASNTIPKMNSGRWMETLNGFDNGDSEIVISSHGGRTVVHMVEVMIEGADQPSTSPVR